MKTNFSKYWHIFYLIVIIILTWKYYFGISKQMDLDREIDIFRVLSNNTSVIENANENALLAIDKKVREFCLQNIYAKELKSIKNRIEESRAITSYLSDLKFELIKNSGGLDVHKSTGIMIDYDNSYQNRFFFDRKKTDEIENKLKNYVDSLKTTSKMFHNFNIDESMVLVNKIKQHDVAKLSLLTPILALQNIEILKGGVETDLQSLLNSFDSALPPHEDFLVINVLPNNKNPKLGENFSAGIILKSGESLCNTVDETPYLEYWVNDKKIDYINSRLAFYSTKNTKLGENKIKVEIKIKNPLTGEFRSVSTIYKYNVGS